MINSVKELKDVLIENDGKIFIRNSLLCINGVSNYSDIDIRMIYMDLDSINSEDCIVEFCDVYGSIVLGIHLEDLKEFEQICEYDECGNIIE